MTTLEAEFYFSPQKTPIFVFAPIGMRYLSSPTPPPFEHAVWTLCLHGARAFVNTRHAHTIQHLSRSMWLDWCIEALDRESLNFTSLTALSRRLIQVQANVVHVGDTHFWMRIKGLGFFGEGPTAACLTSFFVHYNHLSQVWRQNTELTRRLEIAAAEIRWGADKEASVLTQVQFARRAADRALTEGLKR